MKFKYEHNCKWLLVFYHNVINGGYFSNKNEAKFSNNPNKFSILSQIQMKVCYIILNMNFC